ncbi:S8 family peptidase [Massilia sp. S19_KUP03_FR1]|uniref:S8 family peptidase n=1 Tax=Massilia sp. S19_KUP03_FR1 TaxID=3025503 RepID=UPI002FCD2327
MPIFQNIRAVGATPLADNLLKSAIAKPLLELVVEDRAFANTLDKRDTQGLKAVFLKAGYPGGRRKAANKVQGALEALHKDRKIAALPAFPLPIKTSVIMLTLSYAELDALQRFPFDTINPIEKVWPRLWYVVIDVNLKYRPARATHDSQSPRSIIPDPRDEAKGYIIEDINATIAESVDRQTESTIDWAPRASSQYVFAQLNYLMLIELLRLDRRRAALQAEYDARSVSSRAEDRNLNKGLRQKDESVSTENFLAIHQIWPDFEISSCVYRSLRTVKADAAQNSFSAFGDGIWWAVLDSGVDAEHPHFQMHDNIIRDGRYCKDFTREQKLGEPNSALSDEYGHGTHVAGIIAGQQLQPATRRASDGDGSKSSMQRSTEESIRYPRESTMMAASRELDPLNDLDSLRIKNITRKLDAIAGIAPKCKLVSLRVLDKDGAGRASWVLLALEHIQTINSFGRNLKIHGINLSLGHGFNAEWFACGHSPLCVEVNRMVKSGVVVVVAAGNSGYGVINSLLDSDGINGSLDMSINDPGNAELAITVGATHRDQPHKYGVSYFSSKGPTGDGRSKPDLLAPGERIVSAAAADSKLVHDYQDERKTVFAYMEQSGTSQAAPHMSGAVAAFLSIRNEFIGEPERVKQIFTSTATDVGRDRSFQGAGVLDLLRAIQSV